MRSHRPQQVLIGLALVLALGVGLAAAQTSAPYVKVFVDGSPVYFDQPPVIANARVLVPLRGVFERLGATVAWDPASQTVLAQRGTTSVSLRIGSPQAFVDGQAQFLDVPPMLVGGRTMVPLRFISQTLGANVNWDAASYTVQIASQGAAAPPPVSVPPSQAYPPAPAYPPAASTPSIVSGTIVRVAATTYPGQLVVQASGGAIYTYNVVSGTTIIRTNAVTGVSGPVSLAALQPGDTVQVTADQSGTAQNVAATFAQAPTPASPGVITSVTVTPTGRQLVAGDVMTVVATGPAHGTATFTINGLRAGLPMPESAQPGTYIGTYTVRPGDYVVNSSVVVSLTAPTGQLITATAPAPVSINASALVPPASGGAPIITSPAAGSGISTPFTVTGTAAPGSLVKVQADYTGNLLLFNVHGTLGTQTVTADANGNWSATFNQAPPVRGVNVTITAVQVDYTGTARSPSTTVDTTLQ
ncbi:MAG TPA: copper amine oxidase N-terminal domain-containing protein [bacterium]|nr:copper amine oxidase N-terminal domain-containing protein [bacterium]